MGELARILFGQTSLSMEILRLLVTLGQGRLPSQAASSWGSTTRLAADRPSASPKQEGASSWRRFLYLSQVNIAAFYGESFLELDGFSLGGIEVDSAFVETFMEVMGFGPRARPV